MGIEERRPRTERNKSESLRGRNRGAIEVVTFQPSPRLPEAEVRRQSMPGNASALWPETVIEEDRDLAAIATPDNMISWAFREDVVHTELCDRFFKPNGKYEDFVAIFTGTSEDFGRQINVINVNPHLESTVLAVFGYLRRSFGTYAPQVTLQYSQEYPGEKKLTLTGQLSDMGKRKSR